MRKLPWNSISATPNLWRCWSTNCQRWPRSLTRADIKQGWANASYNFGPQTSGAGVYSPEALIFRVDNNKFTNLEILVPQGARKFTFTLGLHNQGDTNRVHRTRILVNNKQVQSYDVGYFDKRRVTVDLPAGSSLITFWSIAMKTSDWSTYTNLAEPQFWG